MMFVHARETARSLQSWQKIPIASHFHSTAARWWKKTEIAWRTEWITGAVSPTLD